MADVLARVAASEGLSIPEAVRAIVLGEIALKAGGDARAAIRSLEALSLDGGLGRLIKKYQVV